MSTLNQNNTTLVKRLYGQLGPADQAAMNSVNTAGQRNAETLAVSATANARRFKGPKKRGHVGIHWFNATASGATSAADIWYSNLPDPDPAVDTDWVKDATITAIDLTTTATGTFINIKDVMAEWIRIKPNVATSAGTVYCFLRVEEDFS